MRLGPAHIHARQHLDPVLRLGTAGAGIDFEVAVIGVGLARQQAFEFELLGDRFQTRQHRLALGDGIGILFHIAQFDQGNGVIEFLLEAAAFADRFFEMVAFAHHGLRARGIVPEIGVLGERVQFVEPAQRVVPVKDASAAGRGTGGSYRRSGRLRRAWRGSVRSRVWVRAAAYP